VGGGVVEFMTIVTLDDFDGAAKLHGKQRQKNWTRWEKCQISHAKKKSTQDEAIIKDNQIILAPKY
jgi:hypothetical protein